eukprot:5566387-Pyramimonas_sp.AAC.1
MLAVLEAILGACEATSAVFGPSEGRLGPRGPKTLSVGGPSGHSLAPPYQTLAPLPSAVCLASAIV